MKINFYAFLFFVNFFLFFAFGYIFNPPSEFDLYRYYEQARTDIATYNFYELVEKTRDINFDFIYTVILYLFAKFDGLAIVNGIFVACYYTALLKISKDYLSVKDLYSRFKLLIFFTASVIIIPVIYALAISRTVAALYFFAISLYLFERKSVGLSVIFLLLSAFTHIGISIILFPIYFIFVFNFNFKFSIFKKLIFITLVVGLLSSASWLNSVLGMFDDLFFFDDYSRYASYLSYSSSIFDDLAYYDVLPIVWVLIVFFFLLLSLHEINKYTFSIYYLMVLMAMFINSSTMLTQRVFMIFPFFLSVLLVENLSVHKSVYVPYIVLLVTAFIFFINFFGYRAFLLESFF